MKDIFSFLKTTKQNKQKIEQIVVADDKEALQTRDYAKFFGYEPFVLPDFRANYGDDLLSFSEELAQITQTLNSYHRYKKANKLLISPIRTITFKLPKASCFDSFDISFGDKIDLNLLKQKLYNWGYYFVDIVTSAGEVSFREILLILHLQMRILDIEYLFMMMSVRVLDTLVLKIKNQTKKS
jgi:transcription-repair coupling factor (superfamily II helicase)